MEEKQQSQVLPTSYQTIHGRSLCCLRVKWIHPNWKKKNLLILGMESPNWDSEVNRGTHLSLVEPFPKKRIKFPSLNLFQGVSQCLFSRKLHLCQAVLNEAKYIQIAWCCTRQQPWFLRSVKHFCSAFYLYWNGSMWSMFPQNHIIL